MFAYIIDQSIHDGEPHTAVMTFKGSSAEESGPIEKQEHNDEIKDKNSKVNKENVKSKSFIKDYSGCDEQISTFKSAEVGNEEHCYIPL